MTTSSQNKLLWEKNHENVEKFKEGHHGNHGDVGCLSLTKSVRKIRLEEVNGTRLFGSFQWKIFREPRNVCLIRQSWSAYNLYGKSGNSRESSNVYGEKGNTFEVLPFFPLSSKRPKFPEPSIWIISARRPPKIVNGTTESHSRFR